ncbi:hypothetical protein CRENBAI_014333 [Crenichthys baileyi]|uniref:Uncharacterized protein n=1 Tax=Crenichthys baileyi TaxID=28760 RepID=A0AAV9SBJ7_9TELE
MVHKQPESPTASSLRVSEGSLQADIITVVAIRSDHKVSTYRLPAVYRTSTPNKPQIINRCNGDGESGQDRRKPRAEPSKDSQQTEDRCLEEAAAHCGSQSQG